MIGDSEMLPHEVSVPSLKWLTHECRRRKQVEEVEVTLYSINSSHMKEVSSSHMKLVLVVVGESGLLSHDMIQTLTTRKAAAVVPSGSC